MCVSLLNKKKKKKASDYLNHGCSLNHRIIFTDLEHLVDIKQLPFETDVVGQAAYSI